MCALPGILWPTERMAYWKSQLLSRGDSELELGAEKTWVKMGKGTLAMGFNYC